MSKNLYNIVRFKRIKTAGQLTNAMNHNFRFHRNIKNVDYEKIGENVYLVNDNKTDIYSLFKEQREKHKFKYIADKYNMFDEFVFSASPDFFNGMSKEDIIKYFKDNIKILKTHFFKVEGSIVSAVIHFDEKTPHCHVLAIPMIEEQKIIKRGKEKGKIVEGQKKISLSHDKILGTKEKCRRLQSIFNFELKNLGYEVQRGLKNTGIKHQSQKEYNRQITEFNKIDDRYLKIEKNLNEIKNLSFIEKIKNINKIIDTIQKHVEKINKFYRAYISTKSINKKIKNENEYLKLRLNNKVKVEGLSFPDFEILENGSNQGCSIARGMDT